MDEITDLISVLSEIRPERFPFERIVSLFSFTAWLHNPKDDLAYETAAVLAGSAIFQSNLKAFRDRASKARLVEEFLTHDVLTNTVLNLRFGYHEVAEDYLLPLAEIANFFLQCPSDVKPSINRAFHFITEGGPDDMESISKQTLNRVWKDFAQVCPFVVTAQYLGLIDFLYLVPDETDDLRNAHQLVSSGTVKSYFRDALAVQNLLLNRFDRETRGKYPWVIFPDGLEASEIDSESFTPFGKRQIKIIRNYKAKRPPR